VSGGAADPTFTAHADVSEFAAGASLCAGQHDYRRQQFGVTRQTLLLDVKEALVDEFVDAEGA
jgi:hypothetical protein